MSQPPIPPTFEDSAACLAKRFSGLRPSYLRRVKSIWSCFRATSYRSAERDAAYWALVQRFIDYARKALHTISTNLPLISGIISIGGGMLFALYFIDIHFMPNLDAASALFLFFVALSGGFIVIFLAFVAFFPGLCARAWTQGGYKPRELWLWFLFPWLTLVCSTALLYFIKASPWWMLVLFGAYCLSPIIVDRAARKDFKNVCINKSLRNKFAASVVFHFLSFSYLNAWISLAPTFIGRAEDIYVIVFALGIGSLNCWVVTAADKRDVFPVLLIYVLLKPLVIPKMVMQTYSIGGFNTTSFIIDEMGCEIAKHQELKIVRSLSDKKTCSLCEAAQHQALDIARSLSDKRICSLCDVSILSRLGSTYYIEVRDRHGNPVRFTMPAQNVLSWSRKQ